jgi:hypothetical protein
MARNRMLKLPRLDLMHEWLFGSYEGAIDLLSWDLLLRLVHASHKHCRAPREHVQ